VVFQLVIFLLIAVLWGMALYRARRYQLSRTLWRGIRGTMTGSPWIFSLIYFGAMILRSMTLGWSTPAMNLNIQERMIGEMRFGSMPFRFKGRAGPLYGQYSICWFASLAVIVGVIVIGAMLASQFEQAVGEFFIELGRGGVGAALKLLAIIFGAILLFSLTQGLLWSLYVAKELSVFAGYTTFSDARFRFAATAGSLVELVLGNFLIYFFPSASACLSPSNGWCAISATGFRLTVMSISMPLLNRSSWSTGQARVWPMPSTWVEFDDVWRGHILRRRIRLGPQGVGGARWRGPCHLEPRHARAPLAACRSHCHRTAGRWPHLAAHPRDGFGDAARAADR
jgi:hypothetical protein